MLPNAWCAEKSWINRIQPTFESSNSYIDPMTPDRPATRPRRRLSTSTSLGLIVPIDRSSVLLAFTQNPVNFCNSRPLVRTVLGQSVLSFCASIAERSGFMHRGHQYGAPGLSVPEIPAPPGIPLTPAYHKRLRYPCRYRLQHRRQRLCHRLTGLDCRHSADKRRQLLVV
jgi:hypothetical protein